MVLVIFLSNYQNVLFPKTRRFNLARFKNLIDEGWGGYYKYYNLHYKLHNDFDPDTNTYKEWDNEWCDPSNPCNISFIMYSLGCNEYMDPYPYPSDYSRYHMFLSQIRISYKYFSDDCEEQQYYNHENNHENKLEEFYETDILGYDMETIQNELDTLNYLIKEMEMDE